MVVGTAGGLYYYSGGGFATPSGAAGRGRRCGGQKGLLRSLSRKCKDTVRMERNDEKPVRDRGVEGILCFSQG